MGRADQGPRPGAAWLLFRFTAQTHEPPDAAPASAKEPRQQNPALRHAERGPAERHSHFQLLRRERATLQLQQPSAGTASRKTKIHRRENLQHAPEHDTASRHAAHTSAAGLSCSLTLRKSRKSMNQSHSKQANGKYVNKSGISVSICRIWAVENEPESRRSRRRFHAA